MATIANLQIDLSARTARFSEGLQRAQQRVQQFSQRVQVDFQRVTQVGQRAALVFSGMTAALTLVTKRAADYASTMDKVAAQTGIAVEQIQELAFAANQSNADLASLESGLRAFVRRTAEAAAGNTSFLKGFERLGFTQEQVRAGLQNIDGFLMQVADRVAELGTTAEQSAVLMTIMGDAGRRLVPFMAQGARGIGELREQARELGLVMDEQAVRRLAAFNDRMAVLQERTSAARREMAVWFLPVMEAGVGLFEDIIGAIQDIDPALRAHAVRWTVVVGAVLGVVGVLGVLGTAVSQAGALLGAFGRLLSLVFSPIVIYAAIAIGAIALFRAAWVNDWLGIRTAATDAWDNYIKPIWDTLGEVWEWAIDVAGSAWDWLTDTTWAEKVEDIKGWLTDGWEWLVNIAGSAWDWLVNTTWAEKIEDVRDWLKSAWDWTINLLGDAWEWIKEHLPWLAATVETLAGWLGDAWSWTLGRAGDAWDWLDQHAPVVTEMIRNLRDWLSSAWDWTISAVGAAWEWLRHLEWVDAIERVKQALSGAWDWTIKLAGEAWEWVRDNAIPFIDRVGDALNTTWNWTVKMGGRFFGWLKDTAWPHLVSVTSTLWHWTIAFFGTFFHWLKDAAWPYLDDKVSTAWDWTVGTVSNFLNWVREEAAPWIGGQVSTGWDWTVEVVDSFLTWIKDTAAPWIGDTVKTVWSWTINVPQWWERFLNWITGRADTSTLGALERIERATGFAGMADILEAIYRAEGGPRARVPYGMTGFEEMGRRFTREINQQRFEEILAATGIQEGSEDFFAAAAAVSVLHYWDTFKAQFPEVGERTFLELEPQLQRLFIEHMGRGFAPPSAHRLNVNWAPNVIGILGITGGGSFQSGTPWTGWGPVDEVAGVVHRREAVIPWDVLRRGPAAVLEFLGMPGFQAGYVPAALGGLTGATPADPDPGFLARLVESVVGGLESRGIIDPETARGLRELTDNLLGIIGGLYDQAKALWEQLGQVDLGEYVAEARRFRDELKALGDVAEQERLAALARIERLDELVEIERLVAEATGQAFDETAFRAQELSRAIVQTARTMFEAGQDAEAVWRVIAPWVEQLEPLQRQLQIQNAVNSALEGFVEGLNSGNQVLDQFIRSLRWESGRIRLDSGGLLDFGFNLIGQFLGSLFGGYTPPAVRTYAAPDPIQQGLAEALAQRRQLEAEVERLKAKVAEAERHLRKMDNFWDRLFGGYDRAAKALESHRRSLQNALSALEAFELREFLGFDATMIARTVESGFDMADPSRLRETLEQTIRDALIRSWVASNEMLQLQQRFGDLLNDVVEEFIKSGELRAGALNELRVVIAALEERGEAFAQVLRELGLVTEEVNRAMSRFVRNLPQGYRVERAIFEAAPPKIPAMASGGIVTRPTVALIGEAGPEAVVPLDGRGFGTVNITIQRMEVQDGRDFGRRLDEELRRRGLVMAGNPTGWRGRR